MPNLNFFSGRAVIPLAMACGLAACENLSVPEFGGLLGQDQGNTQAPPPSAPLPQADARGVISFGSTQAARALGGETLAAMATRLSQNPATLARVNGLDVDTQLTAGTILVLPDPVPDLEPPAATGSDLASLAGAALDGLGGSPEDPAPAAPQTPTAQDGPDPVQHRVARGETAFSISRLYNVSVRSLADWNGLDTSYTVREGQTLLIPLARTATAAAPDEDVSIPGEGSLTPPPPSAQSPLPEDNADALTPSEIAIAPLDTPQTSASDTGRFLKPVEGGILRGYEKGRNEGIDFAAPVGSPVRAAAAGTVAAITQDVDQVPIIVLRHADNVLTVYANVDNIRVAKDAQVARGEQIAAVREDDPSFLHFEIREGFDSVDPLEYLN
ncbi:MAG: peptidoglycan DD-metalloendopeptidase family protein [Pseudomonadota bacterium]